MYVKWKLASGLDSKIHIAKFASYRWTSDTNRLTPGPSKRPVLTQCGLVVPEENVGVQDLPSDVPYDQVVCFTCAHA